MPKPKRRSLKQLRPEERDILDAGKPKRQRQAADQEPTQLMAFRLPVSLAHAFLEECLRRRMAGTQPHTQREVAAEAIRLLLRQEPKG